jgi:predicted Fe-S protein YdhL (DUF1289 family)
MPFFIMKTLKSPCVRNCCLDPNDICLGCFRSLDEILQWGRSETTPQQKIQILANTATRKKNSPS